MVLVLADSTRQYPRIYGGHNNPQIIKNPQRLLYLVQSDNMTVVYYIQRGSSANQYLEQDGSMDDSVYEQKIMFSVSSPCKGIFHHLSRFPVQR